MRLIELINKDGTNIYVNPEKVTYVQQHRQGLVEISFDSAGSELLDRVYVRGSVEYIAERLMEKEDKM